MLADLLEKMNLEEKQICPALSEFRLTGWDGSVTVSELLELLKTEQFFTEWFISAESCADTFGYNVTIWEPDVLPILRKDRGHLVHTDLLSIFLHFKAQYTFMF